jgi:hypothetical protein
MEAPMLYKTMVLELLQQHPEIHERLRRQRKLLRELDRYANELKDRHDAWKEWLSQANPGRGEGQVASEALEIALKELACHFASGSPPDEDQPLSLEGAMAFLRRHTPPA